MAKKFLSRTVQIYTTPRCDMKCFHCSSRLTKIQNMSLKTFEAVLKGVKINGAERIELFANDPLLHPSIYRQIEILNESKFDYALLTVGDSPQNPSIKERFLKVAKKISRERGGFVFSVDFTEKTSREILNDSNGNRLFSYAFKALTFWQISSFLKKEGIPSRINVVISKNNIDEIAPIVQRAVEMGFATSFCFVQVRQPKFDQLLQEGLTPEFKDEFRKFMKNSGLLNGVEIKNILSETKRIIERERLDGKESPFNRFRGNDFSESEIDPDKLTALRLELATLKNKYSERILPNLDFIQSLGEQSFGCIELLKAGIFPQIKILPRGEIGFCCDMHDPYLAKYQIDKLHEPDIQQAFLEMIRINPYIWICVYFNPCDFSVNRIRYDTKI